MERWSSLGTGQKIAVTVGLSAGAAILYMWYCRSRTAPQHGEDALCVAVPSHAAELFFGQDGAITDQLMMQSGAHIGIAEDGGGDRKLAIRGDAEQVRQAQQRLHGILQGGATLRVELHYPSNTIGRIIGKDGERIREITKRSGAAISCERRGENSAAAPTRRISVSGTWEQVAAAKDLLQKASEEAATVQRRAAESSSFRSHRKELIPMKRKDRQHLQEEEQPPTMEAPQSRNYAEDHPSVQENMADGTNIFPSPDFSFRADEYVDVYVSAVENPEHFWIQILGSRSSQLDKLTTEMSDHYQRQNRDAMPEIQVGNIVAAPFHSDNFWYRAEVLGFLKNGNVDLYYVDYGDNGETARENLYPLRSDFLSLPFQAIECRLSSVAPRGGSWSDTALDAFESLSHCAEWKPLLAKISSFPSPGVSRCFQIRLYDPSSDPMLDIGLELIRCGYAVECRTSPMKADEEESLVSRLLEEVFTPSGQSDAGSFSRRQEEEERLASDGSVEMIRADVNPDPSQSAISSPSSYPESVEEADSLEQSISKLHISSMPATSSPSTASSPQNSSSSDSSSISSSTCTASEGPSLVSSMEDSSIYSPRGCFYYLTDETSTSSMFSTTSSGDVITISSDSEDDAGEVKRGGKKAPKDAGKGVSWWWEHEEMSAH
ncbi:tudor and KH domain-containing protein isoform X2 [Dendropsophus ebraccatus]|uniref:tudor and KH domain-containing protein isoform X2 n=1 Tax=Dendropsophus ebraccatus TaxID=150705 RepID=UPI003831F779